MSERNDNNVIKAYKGFNKDLKCRGFQYEVGKEYEQEGKIEICRNGFHACENPFDVLSYYDNILNDRYCEVEQSGEFDSDGEKTASSRISIKAEIGFTGLFKAGIEWIKEVTNPRRIIEDADKSEGSDIKNDNGEKFAQIGSSGYGAKIGSSGDGAQIGSSGDCAQIESTGDDSVICCAGRNSIAKAKRGSLITLSEWVYSEEKMRYFPKCVKTEFVDGERIKEDTWYELKDGEFKEIHV